MQKEKIEAPLLRTDSDVDPRSVLARSDFLRIFVFEVIGTAVFSFGIVCTQYVPPLADKVKNPFHDIFISLSLYLAIVIGAPFSGGHFNPAVSIGLFFLPDTKMSTGKLFTYIIAQFIGAIIGITFAGLIFDCSLTPYPESVGFFTMLSHMIGQAMGGFLFIFMIAAVTTADTTFIYESSWIHLFIPLSLFAARRYPFFYEVSPTMFKGLIQQ